MSPLVIFSQLRYTTSGFVKDSETGEDLIGATILDTRSGLGTIANTYGFFSLTLAQDSVNLRVSYVGYANYEESIYLSRNIKKEIDLKPGQLLQEVVVTASENVELSPQMSVVSVPMKQIQTAPMLMGEVDVMKTLQLLPGIQGGNEGTSGVYVRGGGPDQNLILIDGVPVYNVNHLFGFFSVFNADAINNVNVIKGGFPARYGGRLSSIIDLSMKEGNNQKMGGTASIGLISSRFTIEGPIKNENTSFIFSARRTYLDLIARPIIKSSSGGDDDLVYFFQDLNAKINHRFSDKDRIYCSFYGGKDKFYFKYRSMNSDDLPEEEEGGLDWGNVIGAIRWNHLFSQKLFANITGTYSTFNFDIFQKYDEQTRDINNEIERDREEINYNSGIEDLALKVDFDFLPSPAHSIKFGSSIINHTFSPGAFGYKSELEQDTTYGATKISAVEVSSYLEDDIRLGKKIALNVGVHLAGFNVRSKWYNSVQPRLSARYLLSGNSSIKASYSEMTQFIHLLTNSGTGLPTDLWVPATDDVKPQQSWQVALGYAKTMGDYEVSLEGYYKEMKSLISYLNGATYFNTDDNWEEKITSGDGDSHGVEFLIQKKSGTLTGWIGYTWSKTMRQFEELNNGDPFPYRYDRRHDVSLVAAYDINERISVSGNWVYGTGNAITLPNTSFPRFYPFGFNFLADSFESSSESNKYFENRNDFRMRSYHRLDLGISFKKPKKNGERIWSLGFYNAYNRRNPFFVEVAYDEKAQKDVVKQFSLLPTIPYIVYKFNF
ncbi:MAG: TonB-dependent receptor plug domain-containing protein [Ekhidna sp.]|nr:TonB-dependent receptor plug domain-containing protein [Ekhidna sp.]